MAADDLKISPQFIMDNDFGYSQYCTPGSAFISANYLQMTGLTVETDENFPYDPAGRQADWKRRSALDDSDQNKYLSPKLDTAEYLLPFDSSRDTSHSVDVPVKLIY